MNKGSYITITFKEWANWIEYSLLRADLNRVKIYNGTPTSMQNVFSAAPDITFIEDNEFVVVSLANDYPRHINLPENSVSCYLSIDSVEHFYAVSERGARLLAHTATNLKTNLSTDIEIAQGWDAFCRQQKKIINHAKAIKFCKIIYPEYTDEISEPIASETNSFVKNLEKFKEFRLLNNKPETLVLENLSRTKAYGGMATRFLINQLAPPKNDVLTSSNLHNHKRYNTTNQLEPEIGQDAFDKYESFSKEIDCKSFYTTLKKLQTRDELTQCFFNIEHIILIKEKIGSEAIIEKNIPSIQPIPLLALSLYLHYEMLLKNEIEINLSNLKFDLETLKHCYNTKQSDKIDLTVAYLLGELYPDVMVNSLYAAKTGSPSIMNNEYIESLKYKLPTFDQAKFDLLTERIKSILYSYKPDSSEKPVTTSEPVEPAEDSIIQPNAGDNSEQAVLNLESPDQLYMSHILLALKNSLINIENSGNIENPSKNQTWGMLLKELNKEKAFSDDSPKNVEALRKVLREELKNLESTTDYHSEKYLRKIFKEYKEFIKDLHKKSEVNINKASTTVDTDST